MGKSLSPLRYPGGKYKIYNKVRNLIETNALGDKTYVEPFGGGFGVGLGLLCDDIIGSAVLNDIDKHIYNFWFSVLNHTESLLKRISDTPVSLAEREKQKGIYNDTSSDMVSDGYATLFLNRVNFSGVIKGGPIGGLSQKGTYKIDCRFNKGEIMKKIVQIALLKDRIRLYNYDASDLIAIHLQKSIYTSFINIDPPYVMKGRRLYTNYFKKKDHKNLANIVSKYLGETQWIITYDDCDLVRDIYKQYDIVGYDILHNAGRSVKGKEIVITNISRELFVW
ncbi:MAG TPA: DNA adenine methylase [Thermotogota bacterium]|nr:DNA adenine methylase [Thermotogota bacterium]